MATYSKLCPVTGWAVSYAYGKRKCRCKTCKLYKKKEVYRHRKANRKRASAWRRANKSRVLEHAKHRLEKVRQLPYGYDSVRLYKNFTGADYIQLLKNQGGKCAICGGTNGKKRLVIDHSHRTQKVRGLLCGGCNWGIGHLGDSIAKLKSAINYLKRNGDIV